MNERKRSPMLWLALALTLTAAVAAFLQWYYAPPDMPGDIPNRKLVKICNDRLGVVIGRMTTAISPGLSDRASTSAAAFMTRVQTLTQHCNYKHSFVAHNNVVLDLKLTDGSVIKDLYNGGLRCPSTDVPGGLPIMRIRFDGGRVVEITTDKSERSTLPTTVVPTIDGLIKNVISYDMEQHPEAYYKAPPAHPDLE
jgi:hypothetical protein